MFTKVQHTLLNNFSLKLIAFIIGYGLWILMSAEHTTTVYMTVPVSFYNVKGYTIDAPETVNVRLHGKRNDLYTLSHKLAFHIDGNTLAVGKQSLFFESSLLFLPDTVTLIESIPKESTIEVRKTE